MKSNFPEQEQYAHQISTEQLVDMSEFLRMWFGIEHLQFGDRKPCDLLLIRILNLSLSQSSLRNWGKAPAYPKIPKTHHRNLTHFHQRMLQKFP
jgi:hypothetical protein